MYPQCPRRVRVWDESWLPGKAITVDRYEVAAFISLLWKEQFPELAGAFDDLFAMLRSQVDGARVELPAYAEESGHELNDVLRVFDLPSSNLDSTTKEKQRQTLSALWALSGRSVIVRRDDGGRNTMLDYAETLPPDLAPLLVLDASGRVRETYAEMEKRRSNIVRLKTAKKRYNTLTIHVWQRGGGKSSFEKKNKHSTDLIDGIASTMNQKPDQEWLTVVHKANNKTIDTASSVRALLVQPEGKHFIHWGRHDSTNDFAHAHNIILAGTLFYRPSQYEAIGRCAADLRPEDGDYSAEDRKRIALGEHRHGILQALCRGAVRLCDGDVCQPAHAYIIASVQSGIPAALREIFPGCKVRKWRPVRQALRGKVAAAVNYLKSRMNELEEGLLVKFTEVQKAIDVASRAAFKNNIRDNSQFRQAIAELGIVEWGANKYYTGFKVLTAEDYGFTVEEGYTAEKASE